MCVVVDSAVWFSLACGNLAFKALQLGSRICAVDYVVSQELVSAPNGGDLAAQGLRVEEVSPEGVQRTREWRQDHPRLTVGDVLSLALAWERGWRLATRDFDLEELARRVGVPVLCVVDVMGMMASAGLLTAGDIRAFKRGMFVHKEPYDRGKLRNVEKLVRGK